MSDADTIARLRSLAAELIDELAGAESMLLQGFGVDEEDSRRSKWYIQEFRDRLAAIQ